MIFFVRLREHVKERLHERLTEWEHSVLLIIFGSVLAQPLSLVPHLPHENGWGIAILALGLIRFGSLVVNGYRRRVTSWLRALSAVIGFFVFALISATFFFAGAMDGPAVLFPVVALFEIFNYGRAMRDAGNSHGRSV